MNEDYQVYQAKFGELFEEELNNEAYYKRSAEDHLQLIINHDKAEGRASETSIGRNLTTWKLEQLTDAIEEVVNDIIRPRAGAKSDWHYLLMRMDSIFTNKEGEPERKALCSMLSYACLSCVINGLGNERGTECLMENVAKQMAPIVIREVAYHEFMQFLATQEKSLELSFKAGLKTRVSPHYRRYYMKNCMKADKFVPTFDEKSETDKQAASLLCARILMVAEKVLGFFTLQNTGFKKMLAMVPTQEYIEGWKRNETNTINHAYRMCPMVIPPKPWTDYDHGGYYGDLAIPNKLLRLDRGRGNSFHRNYMRLLNQTDLSDVLKALNGVQATPWTINKKMLEVVNEIVKLGGGIAGIPKFEEDPKPMILPDDPTSEQIEQYKKVMPDWYRGETRRKSIILRSLGDIKVANDFSKYEKIWFPCNLDFRGRLYPICSFNFQGTDLNKALLLFADPPACDCLEDIRWLAITGANLAGHDKISFDDRVKWVAENEMHILRSAADPIGYQWWADQDEPCQMLAWCFEWARWIEWSKEHDGDPKGFVTGLPSHQDGTCSGLQHYSGILRDPVGGTAVNLVPQDKPNDIYALVANEVNKLLKIDASQGTPNEFSEDGKIIYGTKYLAQLWLSFGVTRKVTKRPTMTLAYGATEYGYRDQIMEDTIEPAIRDQKESCVFDKNNKWKASAYMASLIWNGIDKVVVKACEGMTWLQTCSKLVCKQGKPVTWVTPLGLPIQQNYMKPDYKVVRMAIEGKRIRIYMPQDSGEVAKSKQRSAIAPNFIHSMDACHLQWAINYCLDAGIKHFATIHDSYGCPMAQTKVMFKCVRQAFIDMYTQNDVLKNFQEDMSLITNDIIPEPPKKGTLDLDIINDSQYIFC